MIDRKLEGNQNCAVGLKPGAHFPDKHTMFGSLGIPRHPFPGPPRESWFSRLAERMGLRARRELLEDRQAQILSAQLQLPLGSSERLWMDEILHQLETMGNHC